MGTPPATRRCAGSDRAHRRLHPLGGPGGGLGGDEFAVLVEDVATPRNLQFVAEKLVAAMRGPMEVLDSLTLQASASVGIGMNAAGSRTPSGVQLADGALYQADAPEREHLAAGDRASRAAHRHP